MKVEQLSRVLSQNLYPKGLLDRKLLLNVFSSDTKIAQNLFKEINERKNVDQCIGEIANDRRLTEEVAMYIFFLRCHWL